MEIVWLASFQFCFSLMEGNTHSKESNILSAAGNPKLSSCSVADCIPENKDHLTLDD
jgi:hypothetical protein